MKVLATKDLSTEGNDCWINKSVSIVESFETLYILLHTKVSGWCPNDELQRMSVSEWKHFTQSDPDIRVFVNDFLREKGLI